MIPEIEDENIREVFLYSYRLIYEIASEKIKILAIIHGRQDFSRAIDKKKVTEKK